MPKSDLLPVPYPKFVNSYGKFGRCENCKYAVDSTAEIQGRRLCRECKDEKHPKSSAKFQETDATFKCPAKSCGADKLSYREFYVGSCCDAALDRDVREEKNEELLLMQKIYHQSKADEKIFREKWEETNLSIYPAKMTVEDIEVKLYFAKEKLKMKEDDAAKAWEKHLAKTNWRKKVQKRIFIAAKSLAKEDNSDFEEEPVEKRSKQNAEHNSRSSSDEDSDAEENRATSPERPSFYSFVLTPRCMVCDFGFDNEHQEAIITPCGHKACFNCISNLSEKKCPKCKADFTDENVYKVSN
ncbi:Oidioi.mRNA.OKI2018_I69.XSR.g13493.t1.cds [Oikopleura dioica]|uniref:Oidioi.mRNA.OKI2018_I69.XSR.g13493.t1.cds n=1 Tax=Oikopleura dioica TaxID=34765 RepID=A0ABN7S8Q7_OIKDI|nr:Oidioi.mRNA.OKI2018_I69.XSR.g13493.t1.cds [Oikopleura dioica]